MNDTDSRAVRSLVRQLLSWLSRMLVTWWFGAILLIGSAIGYTLSANLLVQFFLVLTGEAGLIFIVTDLIEKELREELAIRIIKEVKDKFEGVSQLVEDRLKQSFDLLDNASHNGLLNVLPPRRDQTTINTIESRRRTIQAIRENLAKCQGKLRVSGISLLDFFLARGQTGEFFDTLQRKAQREDLEVRVLLMDPKGHSIRLRKHVERGGPSSPILQIDEDIRAALTGIKVLREIAERASKSTFSIKVRFYSFLPQAYFIITDSALFIEQYHFAPTEKLRFWGENDISPCTGGRVPVLHFAPDSNAYLVMREHFDLIWELSEDFSPEITVREAIESQD